MKPYISYFKIQLINSLQYRTAALAGIATQFFWGFIFLFLYKAFYESGNSSQPFNFDELATYIWLNQAFFALIYMSADKEIIESIKTGSVCYELTKPYNLYVFWYIKIIVKKLASVFLRFSPIIFFALILSEPYNLSLPLSSLNFLLFFISLSMGSLVIVSLMMIVNIFAFYNYSDDGITSIILIVFQLLSGLMLPVPFLPDIIQKATYYLPFRLIGDLPFRIYSGNMPIGEAVLSICLQLFWIFILIILGYRMLLKATKKIYIQGG